MTISASPPIRRAMVLAAGLGQRMRPITDTLPKPLVTIAGRAIVSLIQTQGVGDLYRIYLTARRDGMDYNLAYMPSDFTMELKEPFDTAYMNALFERGYEMAVKGYPWAKVPPGFSAPEIAPPLPPAQ